MQSTQICLSGCRGEHCSPVRFTRYIVISGWLRGRSMTAPTSQPIVFIIIYGRGRGLPRPYRAMIFYCPVGRGDLTPPEKPSPFGGRWRGTRRMRGECPAAATNQPVSLQYPQISPSSVTCGDSFPQRGKPKPLPLYTNFTYTLPVYAGKTHTVSFIIENGIGCGILPRPHTNNRTDV